MSDLVLDSVYIEYPIGSGNYLGASSSNVSLHPSVNFVSLNVGNNASINVSRDSIILTTEGMKKVSQLKVGDVLVVSIPSVLVNWNQILASEVKTNRDSRERWLKIKQINAVVDGTMVPDPVFLTPSNGGPTSDFGLGILSALTTNGSSSDKYSISVVFA